ncbi:hypothetical protein PM082_022925, partial [Marasmius tenuissimus]
FRPWQGKNRIFGIPSGATKCSWNPYEHFTHREQKDWMGPNRDMGQKVEIEPPRPPRTSISPGRDIHGFPSQIPIFRRISVQNRKNYGEGTDGKKDTTVRLFGRRTL